MKINKFHHVSIICSDYEQSKHFYVEILGFPIIKETFRAECDSYKLDLQVGDRDQIELLSFPEPLTGKRFTFFQDPDGLPLEL
ncbi:VOC family protein [Trichocoleus sp. FACHB-591]|uniref:VOC family protein n=1 Tax=Trichocoleus sp. FACHB-591 TaxID=2692872 RepID=UPI00168392F6|nr:VOC family protein [Trichocoleus sp. FACHB-591]MBD2097900.1 VOC family protein [Trichocoleus sp. FACHB-591]